MDPVSLGAVLLAIIGGASGELGSQLWAGVAALVCRPFHFQAPAGQAATALPTGDAELATLEKDPANEQRARALAQVLIARASADVEFQQELQSWWEQAGTLRINDGSITNTISGGTQLGPVLQGRDFGDISFGTTPVPRTPDQPV